MKIAKKKISKSEVDSLVVLENSEGVATLTLNNPDKRNALSREMLEELHAQLHSLAGDDSVRVVIVASEGPVFSSGHNMKELVGVGHDEAEALFSLSASVMKFIQQMPKPVIARVAGLASAAGCQLVASCDLVMASDTASFQTPGVMIGLFCSTPMVPLCRAVPAKKAMEMLLTGRPIGAEEAERAGLVTRVVPAGRLVEETLALAREIAQYSRYTLAVGKEAFYKQLPLPVHEAYEVAKEAMTSNAIAEDAQEGMSAFLEKRKPKWKR